MCRLAQSRERKRSEESDASADVACVGRRSEESDASADVARSAVDVNNCM